MIAYHYSVTEEKDFFHFSHLSVYVMFSIIYLMVSFVLSFVDGITASN
jgi:hypothetical protein